MAVLRVPSTCSSITITGDGALVPAANKVTVSSVPNFTDIVQDWNRPRIRTTLAGLLVITMSAFITSITINGNVYAVTAGVSASMNAVDGTSLLYEGFGLVTGS